MNVSLEERGQVVIIRVREGCWLNGGIPNWETATQLKNELSRSLELGRLYFILDFERHVDPLGDCIGVISTIYKLIKKHNGQFKICNSSIETAKELKLCRLDNVFEIYDSINSAIELNHYHSLKLSTDATKEEIESAYLRLSEEYESRWLFGDTEAEKARDNIEIAFDVLSDPVKRKEHDEWIAKDGKTEEALHRGGGIMSQPPQGSSKTKAYVKVIMIGALVTVTLLCAALWGRYKPIGNAGQFVYVHDRITGEVFALVGVYRVPITEKRRE